MGPDPSHGILGHRPRLRYVGREWLVIVARRHVASITELDDPAAAELGWLTRDLSRALTVVVGCEKTCVAQFAEHPQHGPQIFQAIGVDNDQAVAALCMDDIARLVRTQLT